MSLTRHLSARAQRMHPLAIREILCQASHPDIIPFIAGQPEPSLFPTQVIGYQAKQIFQSNGPEVLQYGNSQGLITLRNWVASRSRNAAPENVVVISGSQQALDISAKLLVMPGDKIIVAAPTYAGALSTYAIYGAEFIAVPCDDEGMLPDELEKAFQQDPRLIYAIPNFMNPTGVNMSLARRRQLAQLAQSYDVPILEDDPYGELRFEGERLPNLYELAPEHVVYASTFSKILAPGLRLAWMIVPDWLIDRLITAKQTSDLQSATYTQHFVADLLEDDFMERHILKLRSYYRQQRDWMLTAVSNYFPSEVQYTRPTGGMFVWCELPNRVNATHLLKKAIENKVAYMPGSAFFHDDTGHHTVRLSFTIASEAQISEGISILGQLFEEALM
ncbi:MAG: PLP-dependent aminotransferase family protein [Chloroflexota bacterium]